MHRLVLLSLGDELLTPFTAYLDVTGVNSQGQSIKSRVPIVDEGSKAFRAGEVATIKVPLVDIQKPTAARLGHDSSGSDDDWHVDRIVFRNQSTGEATTILCREDIVPQVTRS